MLRSRAWCIAVLWDWKLGDKSWRILPCRVGIRFTLHLDKVRRLDAGMSTVLDRLLLWSMKLVNGIGCFQHVGSTFGVACLFVSIIIRLGVNSSFCKSFLTAYLVAECTYILLNFLLHAWHSVYHWCVMKRWGSLLCLREIILNLVFRDIFIGLHYSWLIISLFLAIWRWVAFYTLTTAASNMPLRCRHLLHSSLVIRRKSWLLLFHLIEICWRSIELCGRCQLLNMKLGQHALLLIILQLGDQILLFGAIIDWLLLFNMLGHLLLLLQNVVHLLPCFRRAWRAVWKHF